MSLDKTSEDGDSEQRATAERIITEIYAHVRRPAPVFFWFEDPLSCTVACNLLSHFNLSWAWSPLPFKRPMGGLLPFDVWSQLESALAEMMSSLWSYVTREEINLQLRPFWTAFWGQLERQISIEHGAHLRQISHRYYDIKESMPLGNYPASPAEGFLGGSVVGGVTPHGETGPVAARLAALQRACCWWHPCERLVVCSERHWTIHVDRAYRLHHEHAPAVGLSSTYPVYAWHGTRVPAEWIEQRETLDPRTALTWPNLEQRRVAADIVGWTKVLEYMPTRVIHADRDPQIGTLIECQLPNEEPSRFLRVRCGTGRDFALRVPFEMTTARQANAWTYGIAPDEYQLEART